MPVNERNHAPRRVYSLAEPASRYHAAATQSSGRIDPAPLLQRLVEQQVIKPKERILCYGCGRGADLAWLRTRKYTVNGYDPRPPYGHTTMPVPLFDWVTFIYLMRPLEHEENRRKHITAAFAKVRPGGRFLLISRHWARIASEAGAAGRDEAIAHFKGYLPHAEIAEWDMPVFNTGQHELCLIARRTGVHDPNNPVEMVETPDALEDMCARLAQEKMVALDVETTLEEPRQLCTVQLGIPGYTYIVDAIAIPDLSPLKAILENTCIEKIIHNASFEEQMLGARHIRIHNIFDTLDASRKKYRKGGVEGGHKLGEVCERELGIYLDKALQTSDWTQRPLTEAQLKYAALDAEVLIDLYDIFHPPKPPETMPLF
jgi:hypothetical protein